jgi:hypothetical protein
MRRTIGRDGINVLLETNHADICVSTRKFRAVPKQLLRSYLCRPLRVVDCGLVAFNRSLSEEAQQLALHGSCERRST